MAAHDTGCNKRVPGFSTMKVSDIWLEKTGFSLATAFHKLTKDNQSLDVLGAFS